MRSKGVCALSGHAYHTALAETKQAQIVDAARKRFLDQGFSRASMAEIAEQAKVSTTTLYRHFKSKDVLFEAVLDGVRTQFAQALDDVALPADDLRGGLRDFAEAYIDILSNRDIVGMARVIIAEAAMFQPLAASFHDAMKGEVFHRLVDYLRLVMETEKLVAHDPGDSMGLFLGYVERSFLLPRLLDPQHVSPADARTRVSELASHMVLSIYGKQ